MGTKRPPVCILSWNVFVASGAPLAKEVLALTDPANERVRAIETAPWMGRFASVARASGSQSFAFMMVLTATDRKLNWSCGLHF